MVLKSGLYAYDLGLLKDIFNLQANSLKSDINIVVSYKKYIRETE